MAEQDRLYHLLERYDAGTCSQAELAELSALVNATGDADMYRHLDALFAQQQPTNGVEGFDLDAMFHTIIQTHPARQRSIIYKLRYVAAAAAVLLFVMGAWYFNRAPKDAGPPVAKKSTNDIAPGKYGAILRLADSSTIVLDSAGTGKIAQQGAVGVIKADSSRLAYRPSTALSNKTITYNILTTPKGRQFQVELEDGTRVWLNAGSSLTYPTAFIGNTREVMLTGEAYFEVAKNPLKPFHVRTGTADVQVLGTHFNVMAYTDEPAVEATLLEGLVQVSKGSNKQFISPGQQAILPNNAPNIRVVVADTDKVMAWKEGFFQFDETDLAAMLRQLSRWYDVDVSYEGSVPNRKFFGRINRNMNLSAVLQILEANNIRFRIEGNKIIVTP